MRAYPPLGISFHHLADDTSVKSLVARLVRGDLAADPREILLSLSGGKLADVAVRDPRRTLLERRVDQPLILVIPAGREPISDQVMNGPLNRRACPRGQ